MENGLHRLDRVVRAELGTKTWLGFAGRTKKCVGSLLTGLVKLAEVRREC